MPAVNKWLVRRLGILAVGYLAAIIVLSSVDVGYSWYAPIKAAHASAPSDAFDIAKDGHGAGFAHGVLTIGGIKRDADDVAALDRDNAVLRVDLKTVDDVITTLTTLVHPIQIAWTAADAALAKEPSARARLDAACAR